MLVIERKFSTRARTAQDSKLELGNRGKMMEVSRNRHFHITPSEKSPIRFFVR